MSDNKFRRSSDWGRDILSPYMILISENASTTGEQELNQELGTKGILPLEEKLKADVSVVEVIKAEVLDDNVG